MSAKLLILSAVATALLVTFCGPSLRRTYQSDNAFERCFDMDYNPGKTVEDKTLCWQTWQQEYTYNQPADKISYAELRIDELAKGVSVPGPPGPAGAFDKRPLPEKGVDFVPDASPDQDAAAYPTEPCEQTCRDSMNACRITCQTDAGINAKCTEACDAGYKACMKSCFS